MGNCDSCLDGVRTFIIGETPDEILRGKAQLVHTPVVFARELATLENAGDVTPTLPFRVSASVDAQACLALIDRAREGDVEGVRFHLKRSCVDVNYADKNYYNFTALHMAASKGHSEVVHMLLEQKGIDVDPRSEAEQTPLIMAARSKHMKIVDELTAAGANLDAKPNHGSMSKSARDYMIEAAAVGGVEEAISKTKVLPVKARKIAETALKDPSELHSLSEVNIPKQRSHLNLTFLCKEG